MSRKNLVPTIRFVRFTCSACGRKHEKIVGDVLRCDCGWYSVWDREKGEWSPMIRPVKKG